LTKQLIESVRSKPSHGSDEYALEKALLLAYSDRVARRRGNTLLLSGGGSATLDANSHVANEFLVALEIDDRSGQANPLVRIASEVKPDWLLEFFPDQVQPYEEMAWNREPERAEQVNSLRYGQLVIDESRGAPTDTPAAAALLASKAIEAGIERFTDAEELHRFLRRIEFAAAHDSRIEVPSDLQHAALAELATGLNSFADLREAAKQGRLLAAIASAVPMAVINEVAPEHVQLPSGRRARIEYHEGRAPSVASRLQDFFGMKQTPTVARGTVPLVVHLLAPNQRPVQMTTDLVSFWKNLYPQVRRELSRRYPRHAWPETPA
jgi:ATP-dependent helicase HrpB